MEPVDGRYMALFKKKEPEEVFVCGRRFVCTVCGNDRFWRRDAQLNTAIATFFSFDWANRTARCAVCTNCGYIHWFLPD